MFTGFIEDLNSLRERTARFRRVVLHVHSPDSHDWGKNAPDKAKNDRSRFTGEAGLDTFLGELRPHFDCVAINDHMKCTFGTQLSARTVGDHEFMVFPGMEVNFRLEPPLKFSRIHLLAILPAGATPEDFARLFHGLKEVPAKDGHRTGQEEVAGVTLYDWIERVHAENGVCIAAHVNNKQGIRYRFRQAAKETLQLLSKEDEDDLEKANDITEDLKHYLLTSGLDAIEIHKSQDARHYHWVSHVDGLKRHIATVLTSDPHTIEAFQRPERTTYIKMTRLALPDLKDAFQFPETRIRFPHNVPPPPSPRILGIRITGGDKSFFSDITVAVAENLNCLIGVRGSGKSTLVEALRYVFGYNRTLNELDKLENSIRDMQKRNLVDSTIRVAYLTKTGDTRILEATFDEKADYTTKVFTETGEPIEVADVELSGDYPLRLFGWSEIETLGRDPAKQRDLLDRLIPELTPVLSRRKALRNDLVANRGEVARCVLAVKAAFEEDGGKIKHFMEYTADFQKLNTSEVKELFGALDLAQDKRRVLKQLQSNTKNLIERLGKLTDAEPVKEPDEDDENDLVAKHGALSAISLRSKLEKILGTGSDQLRNWWLEEELGRLSVTSAEADVQKSLLEATERIRSLETLVTEHIAQSDSEIEQLQRDLRNEFTVDDSMQRIADLRANAEKRLRKSSGLRDAYLGKWKDLRNALEARQEITEQLASVQNEIAGIRSRHNTATEETLNRFLPENMEVSIHFEAGRDTEEFNKVLRTIFGARSNQVKRIRQIVEHHCTPVGFASMCLKGNHETLIGQNATLDDTTVEFEKEDAQQSVEKTSPFEHDEHADVDTLAQDGQQLETILKLQETTWDDYETILLDGGPVNKKSPGQRSSAMLPLIALAESVPLVIDQPEDNLDKRLIGSVLMKVLADLKEKRQIIVCTHDPNILVGGDAEQVVVLEAENDRRGNVSQHGSIDNDDIVTTVINLLEGGAEAFKNRTRRYGERVSSDD
ncbi:MAG: AAA family ATPase [Planctomycetes bacterium]|nr:AAA family ATPase [Planctomycetota bacterium]